MEDWNTRTKLFKVLKNMNSRCYDDRDSHYKHYGAKGITVCDEWKNDYLAFSKWAYSNGYKEEKNMKRNKLSIDRIDNSKGYNPSNCRWVDDCIQSQNRGILGSNTSGYIGVIFCNRRKKYIARISINRKMKYLGSYSTVKEGAIARDSYIISNGLEHTLNIDHSERISHELKL